MSIPDSSVISKKARDAHVLKDIYSASLISLGKLCYDGCTDILDKKIIHVAKDNHLFPSGNRDQMDCLWDIPLTAPVPLLSTIQKFQSENKIIH